MGTGEWYYDRDGTPIPMLEWAEKFGNHEYKRVGSTKIKVGGEVKWRISTVWLGLDHRFTGDDPPLIFETMVFGADSFADVDMARYSDEPSAYRGHRDMVNEWLEKSGEGAVAVDSPL